MSNNGNGHPRGALLLGADYRALGVARSLGRRGVSVVVLCEEAEPIASISRYTDRSFRWPRGADNDERVSFLLDLARSHDLAGWALIPTADSTVAVAAHGYDQLSEYFMHTTPPWSTVRWAYDKRLSCELAERTGVEQPRTERPRTVLEAAAVDLTFPVVIKPAVKESFNALTADKAWRVDDRGQMAELFEAACELVDPDVLMVQEVVPGGGEAQFSYAALCEDGVPLASITARRTRQYPAAFGRASTFVETVDYPELIEPSLRLLREIRYTGLIEVEYKRDPRDGKLKLLDMNPRVWGWHTLCGRAGVDFPWLLWLFVSGQAVPTSQAHAGVHWLRFMTDTPTAVREMLGRRLKVNEYARSLRRPRESAIFAWDDPLPGLAELPVLFYVLFHRLRSGKAV